MSEPRVQESGAPAAESRDRPQEAASPGRGTGGWILVSAVTLAVLAFLVLMTYGVARKDGGFAGFGVNTVGGLGSVREGPASDFELTLLSGETFRLSDHQGEVVVLNFWASWCPPCREEAPVLERTWRRYQDRGAVMVGVDIWDTEEDARAFLRQYGITYPNGIDRNGAVAIEYGVTGIPETFFIGPDGNMAYRWVGPLTDQQLAGFIEELLPES